MLNSRQNLIYVVIPAYNEGKVIGRVVTEIVKQKYPVIVVDDGSIDETKEEAIRANAIVVSHPINLGQGAALQTGIDLALELGAEIVVTFDGDGQHTTSDVCAVSEALDKYYVDVVLGSRFLGRAIDISFSRKILLKMARYFTWLTGGPLLSDVHNGIRAIRASVAPLLKMRQPGMAHASEILYKLASEKIRYKEVPVTIGYDSYSKKKGQHSISGAVRILVDLVCLESDK